MMGKYKNTEKLGRDVECEEEDENLCRVVQHHQDCLEELERKVDNLENCMNRIAQKKHKKERKKELKKKLKSPDEEGLKSLLLDRFEYELMEVNSDEDDPSNSRRVQYVVKTSDCDDYDLSDYLAGTLVEALVITEVTNPQIVKLGK